MPSTGLIEVRATVEKKKPLMFTHEADPGKGGGALDVIKMELDSETLRSAVFSEGRPFTVWYRIADFQLISLKQIAEFILLQTPQYSQRKKLDIFVPGELMRKSLRFQALLTTDY